VQDPRARANQALLQAVYYLDRELAPSTKVRAFIRALATVESLSDDELVDRANEQTLTELEGIGPSTSEVISDAVLERPPSYLTKLEARTRIPVGEGGELRDAIRGDCHLHSMWSDGAAPVAAMAQAARALGHEYIVLTDHSARLTVAHGLDETRVRRQLAEVAAVNEQLAPFRVLTGLEVDILEDGSLDLADDLLAELDVVVGSVHSKFRMPREDMTRRLVMAIASPHVDMIGHITNRKVVGGGRQGSDFDAEIVFAACARFDTAIEINCRPERQDPPEDLVTLARQWDLKFCINTDAHSPGQLEWQPYGCDKLAQLDISADSVVNTWSADDLVGWASSR
jgi:putative hydrolase